MSQFIVDGSSLESLRTELGLLHTRLEAMPSLVYGFEGLLGGDNMDQAVEDFCTSWHHGAAQVAGEISDLMGGLQKAADAYQGIDDRVRRRATSGWWGGPRPIGGRLGPGGVDRPGAPGRRIVDEPPRAGRPAKVVSGDPQGPPTGGAPISGPPSRGRGPHHGGGEGHGRPAPATPAPITVGSPLLAPGQDQFVAKLAVLTGLSPRVVAAWTLAQERAGVDPLRDDGAVADPDGAAMRTAEFLQGRRGAASPSVRAILGTAGKSPEQQLAAISASDWGAGGPQVRSAYRELSGLTVAVA